MKKAEFIALVAAKGEMTKKDAEKAIDIVFAGVEDVLVAGDKIALGGFGTFEVKERAERTGRNPATKQTITIPASKVPVFKAGKGLKEKVNV